MRNIKYIETAVTVGITRRHRLRFRAALVQEIYKVGNIEYIQNRAPVGVPAYILRRHKRQSPDIAARTVRIIVARAGMPGVDTGRTRQKTEIMLRRTGEQRVLKNAVGTRGAASAEVAVIVRITHIIQFGI